jgi:hypothetical protein
MFLRINSCGKYKYTQILHNYRDGKRSKHKNIMQLGRYNKEHYQRIKKELKDWKPIKRAATITKEIKEDVANVKKHKKPTGKINYQYK